MPSLAHTSSPLQPGRSLLDEQLFGPKESGAQSQVVCLASFVSWIELKERLANEKKHSESVERVFISLTSKNVFLSAEFKVCDVAFPWNLFISRSPLQ